MPSKKPAIVLIELRLISPQLMLSIEVLQNDIMPGSGLIMFRDVMTQFKLLFDQIRDKKGLNSELCLHVAIEICALGGKRNIKKKDGLDDMGLCLDSKLITI
ncbi:hypothetical protein GLOIN_2v1846435 [Rhizophagus clarus]|uniref:Uncharacterized protein n=1 Tax=Rhizophagus clarus TaxID=94130 RepID=A0A8H3M592_9GLOM|nr:hypothetical protein GLOIN_2v1846435 [Rhizophagus clarus]